MSPGPAEAAFEPPDFWESGEVPSYVYGLASTLLEEADRRRELGGRLCGAGRDRWTTPGPSRHSTRFFPLSRHGPARSSSTAENADRAVL